MHMHMHMCMCMCMHMHMHMHMLHVCLGCEGPSIATPCSVRVV